MKMYMVNSIFGPTIQGEGSMTGRKTLFLRLTGCNMWSGKPEHKESSRCPFCDTEFFTGKRMSERQIIAALKELAPSGLVTISGGEPMLQVDSWLVSEISKAGYKIAIETNGTRKIPYDVKKFAHITVSPKVPREQLLVTECDDLKVLYPHPNPEITPESFSDFKAGRKWIQPVNDYNDINNENLDKAVQKSIEIDGEWGVSIQLHKLLGVA